MSHWNAGQLLAIETRENRVLVTASAGTGKTAVLVERVVRQVLDDQPPLSMDQVLLVTFTNAAAQQMRERISQKLTERMDEDPENQWIQRQLLLLGKSAICTLHAFCLDLVRQNYDAIGIDPQSRILNDTEKTLLMQQILEEVLEKNYEADQPEYNSLISRYSGEKDDEPLRELINQVYEMAISQPHPQAWLQKATALFSELQDYDENLPDEAIEKKLFYLPMLLAQNRQKINRALNYLIEAIELAKDHPVLSGYQQLLQDEAGSLQRYLQASSWHELLDVIEQEPAVFGRLPSVSSKIKKDEAEDAYMARRQCQDRIKVLREQAKEEHAQLLKGVKGRSIRSMAGEIHDMAPAAIKLAGLVSQYIKEYQQLKREKAVMDFNDIEHWALELLVDETGSPTDLARTIQKKYAEVLVDEYQDINPMQETLLQVLSMEGRLFMVGDVKQSIYGFRQAEPKLFLDKYDRFQRENLGQVIPLSDNYRSSQWVIQGINQIFDKIMTKQMSGLDYQTEGQLSCGNPRPSDGENDQSDGENEQANKHTDCFLELHLLDLSSKDNGNDNSIDNSNDNSSDTDTEADTDEDEESPEGIAAEARVAGQRILALMKEKIWDPELGAMRNTRFRDMVILLPAVRKVAPAFVEEFRQLGIPVYADMGTGYFGAQEIQTVVSFLKVIENPHQDIPLAALLLSPAVGLTSRELAEIRLVRREGDLYESLVCCGRRGPQELRKPIRRLLKDLRAFRQQAQKDSLENIILTFYEKTGYLMLAGAMPGGAQRQANLWAMVQRARQFEENTAKGIYAFLKYLEGLEESKSDLSPAAIMGEKDDLVRIMTIHKSKGLEFPIVFLCNAGRRFNMKELQRDVLLHRELGLGPAVVDPAKRIKYPSGIFQTVKQALQQEALAEEMRLLYVALTRAKEKLLVIGRLAKAADKMQQWCNNRSLESDRSGCFLDWLGMALGAGQPGSVDPAARYALAAPAAQSSWQVKYWYQQDLQQMAIEEKSIAPLWKVLLAKPLQAEEEKDWSILGRRFEWRYAYQEACGLPGKRSVSQLKGSFYPEDEEAVPLWRETSDNKKGSSFSNQRKKPKFIEESYQEEQGLTGAQKGTLLHKVLAAIDFTRPWQTDSLQEQLKAWLDELVEKEYLTFEQRQSVPLEPIAAFLMSPLAGRMMAVSRYLRQEASFTMLLPASRIYHELTTDEEVLVQGTVDAYFIEDDKAVLVDFKSDRILPGQEDLLAQRYCEQLAIYAEAITTATGLTVKEQWIYSLALNRAILVK